MQKNHLESEFWGVPGQKGFRKNNVFPSCFMKRGRNEFQIIVNGFYPSTTCAQLVYKLKHSQTTCKIKKYAN